MSISPDDNGFWEDGTSTAAFPGDTGELSFEERRTLMAILKNQYISGADHSAEWKTLMESETSIVRRLNELFLNLHVDREREVAFKRQVIAEDGRKYPTLLRNATYTKEETILMVFLRTRFRSEHVGAATDVFVDRDDMRGAVESYRPANTTDHSGDARRADNAIESLLKSRILQATPDPERLRISPVIEVLMSVERLRELLEWLEKASAPVHSEEPVTEGAGA
jgi:hypothetical protein